MKHGEERREERRREQDGAVSGGYVRVCETERRPRAPRLKIIVTRRDRRETRRQERGKRRSHTTRDKELEETQEYKETKTIVSREGERRRAGRGKKKTAPHERPEKRTDGPYHIHNST
ncbi:hypothetical protein WMY93_014257 [Mugilogobius chulae]|uniref:Uncharacterized protein n=1 Tax=Mugilogobius chulae TaxID=88201 RepID=A0AAW0P4V1_9GOBI